MLIKRAFDIIASFIGLLVLLPLFLTIAILIKINMSEGPVIFTQQRIGRFGKLFTIVKFRTMIFNNAGYNFTLKGEDRITPLGSMLRKYNLDELPELWNVLTGDMSFVGPRPDVPGYADLLQAEERRILLLRPGITGPATLKYRNEEEILAKKPNPRKYNDEVLFPDKVRINLNYLKHQSFLIDLKIIVYTLFGKQLNENWAK